MAAIRNWREGTPHPSHGGALLWPLLTRKGSEGKSPEEAPLEGIVNFTYRAFQAGMHEGYHSHTEKEQVYYIAKGRGKMKLDDKVYDVREGDAIHMQPYCMHQLINDSDEWLVHLNISAAVEREQQPITVAIRSWRDEEPRNNHGAVGWTVFSEKGRFEHKTVREAPLEGFHNLTYRKLQPGKAEVAHDHEAKEHVYYVLEGRGKVMLDDSLHDIRDGDAIHIPPKTRHQLINDSDDWLDTVCISAILQGV